MGFSVQWPLLQITNVRTAKPGLPSIDPGRPCLHPSEWSPTTLEASLSAGFPVLRSVPGPVSLTRLFCTVTSFLSSFLFPLLSLSPPSNSDFSHETGDCKLMKGGVWPHVTIQHRPPTRAGPRRSEACGVFSSVSYSLKRGPFPRGHTC